MYAFTYALCISFLTKTRLSSLSFYKEELEGETKNYICARAAAELLPPVDILRKLVDETLENGRQVEAIAAHDPELKSIWEGFRQVCIPPSLFII